MHNRDKNVEETFCSRQIRFLSFPNEISVPWVNQTWRDLYDIRKYIFLKKVRNSFLKIFLFSHVEESSEHRYIVDERIPLS